MQTPPFVRVVEREWLVFVRLWRGIVFSTFLNPVLFLVAMGVGLGDLVDQNTGTVNGLDYLEFVAPALLVASAVQMAAGESMWPVLAGVKWMRYYHGIVATSIETQQLFAGFVAWTLVRTAISATAFLLVAALLGGVPSVWGVLAVPAASLCAAAFAAPIGAYSATKESDLTFPVILRILILPLFLFSGTFFPISQLPEWLERLAALSPLWHGVELARMATTGSFRAGATAGHVAFLTACIAAGSLWGARTFGRRLTS
jgi:lipooligosaccharide transport system permease protein